MSGDAYPFLVRTQQSFVVVAEGQKGGGVTSAQRVQPVRQMNSGMDGGVGVGVGKGGMHTAWHCWRVPPVLLTLHVPL